MVLDYRFTVKLRNILDGIRAYYAHTGAIGAQTAGRPLVGVHSDGRSLDQYTV